MRNEKVIIRVPEVACITVTGPTQCGKSIVIDRIKRMLESELGAVVVSRDWEKERQLGSMDKLDDWEARLVKDTIWCIQEGES